MRKGNFKLGYIRDYSGYVDFLMEVKKEFYNDNDDNEDFYNLLELSHSEIESDMEHQDDDNWLPDDVLKKWFLKFAQDAKDQATHDDIKVFPDDIFYPVYVCFYWDEDEDTHHIIWYKEQEVKKY